MSQLEETLNLLKTQRLKLKKALEANELENKGIKDTIANIDQVLGSNGIQPPKNWNNMAYEEMQLALKLKTSGEICNEKFPNALPKERIRYLSGVSNALTQLWEQKKIKRADWGGKGWLYGTPEKFNDTEPKPEYLPKYYYK